MNWRPVVASTGRGGWRAGPDGGTLDAWPRRRPRRPRARRLPPPPARALSCSAWSLSVGYLLASLIATRAARLARAVRGAVDAPRGGSSSAVAAWSSLAGAYRRAHACRSTGSAASGRRGATGCCTSRSRAGLWDAAKAGAHRRRARPWRPSRSCTVSCAGPRGGGSGRRGGASSVGRHRPRPRRSGLARAALLSARALLADGDLRERLLALARAHRRAGDRGLRGGSVAQEPHRQRRGDRPRSHPPHPSLRHARCDQFTAGRDRGRARARAGPPRFTATSAAGSPVQGVLTLVTFWIADRAAAAGRDGPRPRGPGGHRGPARCSGLIALVRRRAGAARRQRAGRATSSVRPTDFALRDRASDPRAFIGSMERLATLNLAEREPHPLEELFLYSHPAIGRRMRGPRAQFRRGLT